MGETARKVLVICGVAALVLTFAAVIVWISTSSSRQVIPSVQDETNPIEKTTITEDTSEPMGVTLPSGSVYGNNPTNVINDGMASFYGDWVYYSNITDLLKPHRIHMDGSGDEPINGLGTSVITLYDGWVYYLDENFFIYRVRPDGEGKEQLSTERTFWLNVVDGWIYYTKNTDESTVMRGELWKMRVDGSEARRLREGLFEYLVAYEGWLYFCSPQNEENPLERMLYRTDYEGAGLQELTANASPYTLSKDWLFYGDLIDGALCKMRHDGSDNQKVLDAKVMSMNVWRDWLYYVDITDSSAHPLCRINIETSERQVVIDDRDCTQAYVVGDKILIYVQPISARGFAYLDKGSQVCIVDPDGSNLLVINERR